MKNVMRYHVIQEFINTFQFKVVAEIGVATGVTCAKVLPVCPSIEKYLCVDSWIKEHTQQWWMPKNDVEQVFLNRRVVKRDKRLVICKGTSLEISKQIEDGTIDLVFIDASHDYDSVSADINSWHLKVRKGGILCGHDINLKSVRSAVEMFFGTKYTKHSDNVWVVEYLTIHGI